MNQDELAMIAIFGSIVGLSLIAGLIFCLWYPVKRWLRTGEFPSPLASHVTDEQSNLNPLPSNH